MSTSRLPALDVARGMAALAVVLFHFTCLNEAVREGMPSLAMLTTYGYLGVHLFFLISGFVIFMTLGGTSGAWDFFAARASRLYPAFLLSIVITLAGVYILQGESIFSIRDILLNLTMFPGTLGAKLINPAYWTLSFEIVFYGIVFLSIFLLGKSSVMPVVIVWFTLSAINIYTGLGVIDKLLILKWAPLFSGGAALYLATRETAWRRYAYLLLYFMTMPIASIYALEAITEQKAHFNFWQSNDTIIVSILAALYLLMTFIAFRPNSMSWLPPRFVELCGGGSYILYLIHERIGGLMITMLYPSLGVISVILVIILMIVAAALIYIYFDKPVQRKLRTIRKQALASFSTNPTTTSS